MSWDLKFENERGIIFLKYSGTVSPKELKESVFEGIKLVKETGITKLLTDCREMTWGHYVFDLMSIISEYNDIGISHDLKEAILMPEDATAKSNVEFYETACFNRGYNVKIFSDTDEAIKWLFK